MPTTLTTQQLIEYGLPANQAENTVTTINSYLNQLPPAAAWQKISTRILTSQHPFSLHFFLFSQCYPNWQIQPERSPAWLPQQDFILTTNIAKFMAENNFPSIATLHKFSAEHYQQFWALMLAKLRIVFSQQPTQICELNNGIESPQWLVNAKLNIAESCFIASPDATAIIFQDKNNQLQRMSFAELNRFSNRIANSLITAGYSAKDAIAIDMPMTMEAVAIYLAIIKMGGVVVSIADSFSPEEIATRLRITKANAIFTQDYILRSKKQLPLYDKIVKANAPKAIVLSCGNTSNITLRENDIAWEKFLIADEEFSSYASEPMAACNILFSSGTTGEPKGIAWNHTTAIKAASDAYFHQNIQTGDVLAWPTSLGWMMGPWLIFAAFINKAAIAIYPDNPNERAFGTFIQDAKVTMLGVVPTLVAAWRQSQCMQNLNWQHIRVFSSTGECSNPKDMLYLMSLANYKPIIEYCGGTEIGGSYISSTVIQKNCPSLFSTPAMGSDFILLNEKNDITDTGEVALIPPALGLATELLNANQHEIYYANMPTTADGKILRRHGDQIHRYANGYYSLLGRVDDTMNLGGIKISSAEIERVLTGMDNIIETAAIAISPASHGPSELVIYAVSGKELAKDVTVREMQQQINQHLNPLFKIHDLVFTKELPKTASNKIMRRMLRKNYQENISKKTEG